MPKLTSKPVRYERVTSDRFARCILDLEQRHGSINYAVLCIQSFTSVLLLVDMNKLYDFVVWWTSIPITEVRMLLGILDFLTCARRELIVSFRLSSR